MDIYFIKNQNLSKNYSYKDLSEEDKKIVEDFFDKNIKNINLSFLLYERLIGVDYQWLKDFAESLIGNHKNVAEKFITLIRGVSEDMSDKLYGHKIMCPDCYLKQVYLEHLIDKNFNSVFTERYRVIDIDGVFYIIKKGDQVVKLKAFASEIGRLIGRGGANIKAALKKYNLKRIELIKK